MYYYPSYPYNSNNYYYPNTNENYGDQRFFAFPFLGLGIGLLGGFAAGTLFNRPCFGPGYCGYPPYPPYPPPASPYPAYPPPAYPPASPYPAYPPQYASNPYTQLPQPFANPNLNLSNPMNNL